MSEQRLRVESGPPQHMIEDSDQESAHDDVAGRAQEAAAPAKEKAQEVAGQAKEQAQAVAGQAKEQAQAAAEQAKARAAAQVDERSTQVGQQIGTQAQSLDGVAEELRRQGKDGPAKMADQAAERVERAGSWLADSDADRILGDVEDFARKNPWAVVAGGLALGVVASRFLKASSSDRYHGRTQLPARTDPARFSRPVGTPAVTSGEHSGAGQLPDTGLGATSPGGTGGV
jgi:F0F1-type ATP synthase membrane subunit b/b'